MPPSRLAFNPGPFLPVPENCFIAAADDAAGSARDTGSAFLPGLDAGASSGTSGDARRGGGAAEAVGFEVTVRWFAG